MSHIHGLRVGAGELPHISRASTTAAIDDRIANHNFAPGSFLFEGRPGSSQTFAMRVLTVDRKEPSVALSVQIIAWTREGRIYDSTDVGKEEDIDDPTILQHVYDELASGRESVTVTVSADGRRLRVYPWPIDCHSLPSTSPRSSSCSPEPDDDDDPPDDTPVDPPGVDPPGTDDLPDNPEDTSSVVPDSSSQDAH